MKFRLIESNIEESIDRFYAKDWSQHLQKSGTELIVNRQDNHEFFRLIFQADSLRDLVDVAPRLSQMKINHKQMLSQYADQYLNCFADSFNLDWTTYNISDVQLFMYVWLHDGGLRQVTYVPYFNPFFIYQNVNGQLYYKLNEKVKRLLFKSNVLWDKLVKLNPEIANYFNSMKIERRKLTPQMKQRVLERDNFTCVECGATLQDRIPMEVHHIIPIHDGGKTTLDNLETLCYWCHQKKH